MIEIEQLREIVMNLLEHILQKSRYDCEHKDKIIEVLTKTYDKIIDIFPDADSSVFENLQQIIIDEKNKKEHHVLNLDYSKRRTNLDKHKIVQIRTKNDITKTTIKYDYCPVARVLEKAYDIEFHDIYGTHCDYSLKTKFVKEKFNFSNKEIEIGCRTSPLEENFVSHIFLLLSEYLKNGPADNIPYLNWWHHLLDMDFENFHRGEGGVNYFHIEQEDENPTFAAIRKIFATECDIDDTDFEYPGIFFEIDW